MSNSIVTGNNSTTVIDDKDTINNNVEKTVNKTVNITKVDNTQVENDIKVIRTDLSKVSKNMNKHMKNIGSKLDKIMTKLELLPVADTQKGGSHE